MSEIKLSIDGREVTAQEGGTVLEVALANGIHIPHLCYDKRLTPTGACRLCLVEIEGERTLQTSCTRLALPGMVVRTNTEQIRALRKTTLELLLSEHRVACTTCDMDGDCLLQDYAYEYQASETRFPSVASPVGQDNYTTGNKGIEYDPSKCVRCQRCVKICAEVQMDEALTLRGRALGVEVSTAFDLPLLRRGLPARSQREPQDRRHRARDERARLHPERRQHLRQRPFRFRFHRRPQAPPHPAHS